MRPMRPILQQRAKELLFSDAPAWARGLENPANRAHLPAHLPAHQLCGLKTKPAPGAPIDARGRPIHPIHGWSVPIPHHVPMRHAWGPVAPPLLTTRP